MVLLLHFTFFYNWSIIKIKSTVMNRGSMILCTLPQTAKKVIKLYYPSFYSHVVILLCYYIYSCLQCSCGRDMWFLGFDFCLCTHRTTLLYVSHSCIHLFLSCIVLVYSVLTLFSTDNISHFMYCYYFFMKYCTN